MASKTLLVLVLNSLFFSGLGEVLNSNLRCYHCDIQSIEACADPVDVSALTVKDCNSLPQLYQSKQDNSRSAVDQVLSKPVDGKFRDGSVIEDILMGNTAEKAQATERFICLKVTLSAKDLKATTRTCGQVPSDLKDVCDYLKQETDPSFTLSDCNYCETDKCNSASFVVDSGITIISSLLFIIMKQIF